MKSKLKKTLLLGAILTFLLALTGCDEREELNFSFNERYMQDYTKQLIETYYDVSEEAQEYYLSSEDEVAKTAVSGFLAAQNTDHVGRFLSYKTGDDSVTFKNGANGKVLCSQVCKYEHRYVNVTVAYEENKEFALFKSDIKEQLQQAAAAYGVDVETMIAELSASNPAYDGSSIDSFLESYVIDYYNAYPFKAVEVEVSPIYSKGELIGQAGKNTAIGMGVVFCVLIFISFIISLLKFLPMLFDADIRRAKAESKKAAEEAKKKTEDRIIASSQSSDAGEAVTAAVPSASQIVAADEDLMNDSELVAVITAAIYAASSGEGLRAPAYTASNDKLVVRSIRRVR